MIFFYIYKCHSVTSGLQWLLLVLWTLLLIAENITGFAYSPLKEWSFIPRSLIDWFLCYICFLLMFSAKLLLPPLLMKEIEETCFGCVSFPPGHITVLSITLFSLPSMRTFLWAVAKRRSFKNHSLGRMNCYLGIVSILSLWNIIHLMGNNLSPHGYYHTQCCKG